MAFLLIKVLELFTSEFKYLGIKVSKSAFILIPCLFLDGTSFKVERDGKLSGVKISHRVFYRADYMRYHLQWVAYKQKKSQFLRKWNGRILEFCFLCQDKCRSAKIDL